MQLGAVVDYCIAYNDRQKETEEASEAETSTGKPSKPEKVNVRYATQEEIAAYWN